VVINLGLLVAIGWVKLKVIELVKLTSLVNLKVMAIDLVKQAKLMVIKVMVNLRVVDLVKFKAKNLVKLKVIELVNLMVINFAKLMVIGFPILKVVDLVILVEVIMFLVIKFFVLHLKVVEVIVGLATKQVKVIVVQGLMLFRPKVLGVKEFKAHLSVKVVYFQVALWMVEQSLFINLKEYHNRSLIFLLILVLY
jgi:hypothetical protein